MTLLEVYKEKNKDEEWSKKFSSTARDAYGTLFGYTDTNFRKQETFCGSFAKLEEIEGKDRSEWGKTLKKEQEKHKQYIVNCLAAKLFKRMDKQSQVKKTEKGLLYKQFIESVEFNEDEKWLINYIFLINGHWLNEPMHIIKRAKEVSSAFDSISPINNELQLKINESLNLGNVKFEDLIKYDFFYILSFYADPEFLEIYLNSSDEELAKFRSYVQENQKEKSKNKRCCISKKMYAGGSYSVTSALDEARVFYITNELLGLKETNFRDTVSGLLEIYSGHFTIDKDKVAKYIYSNSKIFEVIISEILDIDSTEELIGFSREEITEVEDEPQEFIDTTSRYGKNLSKNVFKRKKREVRRLADFKCKLMCINMCTYFTGSVTKENYVQVHHLIPREFATQLLYSIEVFANYVVLCPHCHELLHHGVDRERKPSLNYLYNVRKTELKFVGLEVTIDELYDYYGVTDR